MDSSNQLESVHFTPPQRAKKEAPPPPLRQVLPTVITILLMPLSVSLLEYTLRHFGGQQSGSFLTFLAVTAALLGLFVAAWQVVWFSLALIARISWAPASVKSAVENLVMNYGSGAAKRMVRAGAGTMVASGLLVSVAHADSGGLWPDVPAGSEIVASADAGTGQAEIGLWDSIPARPEEVPAPETPPVELLEPVGPPQVGPTPSEDNPNAPVDMRPPVSSTPVVEGEPAVNSILSTGKPESTTSPLAPRSPQSSTADRPTVHQVHKSPVRTPAKASVGIQGVETQSSTQPVDSLGRRVPAVFAAQAHTTGPNLQSLLFPEVDAATRAGKLGEASRNSSKPQKKETVEKSPPREIDVTVAAGDSLWAIAANHLVPAEASDSEIDVAWRELYAQNHKIIGADPNVIHPGMILTLPTH